MSTFFGPFSNDEIASENRIKNLFISKTEIDFSCPLGTYNVGDLLPLNSIVLEVFLKIDVPFDGNPSLTIGNTTNPSGWFDSLGIDFLETGIFVSSVFEQNSSTTQGRAYWNPNTCTKGRFTIFLLYSEA